MTKRISRKHKGSTQHNVPLWEHSSNKKIKKLSKPSFSSKRNDSSPYGVRLKEKQKLKAFYGNITEKQLSNLFTLASKKKGKSGNNLLSLLEKRLDSIIYRSNLAPTVFSARQLISHGHILVNNHRVTISSYSVKAGDIIQVNDKSIGFVCNQIQKHSQISKQYIKALPSYLEVSYKSLSVVLVKDPEAHEISFPSKMNLKSIVEFYS